MSTGDDDGLIRCPWAAGALYRQYHDFEWGRPVHDRDRLFERIVLEGFQSGLSWLTILRKRDNFARAFDNFDVERVARFTESDVTRLMSDTGIVRNRSKIDATIANARATAALGGGLNDLLWSFAPHPGRPRPAEPAQVPSTSPESVAMAKALKRCGFRFVGPTTAYALMQATGMVDDHLQGCFRAT